MSKFTLATAYKGGDELLSNVYSDRSKCRAKVMTMPHNVICKTRFVPPANRRECPRYTDEIYATKRM